MTEKGLYQLAFGVGYLPNGDGKVYKASVKNIRVLNDSTGESWNIVPGGQAPKAKHLANLRIEIEFVNDGDPVRIDYDFQVIGNNTGTQGKRTRTTTMFDSQHGQIIPTGKQSYGCHYLTMWSEPVTVNLWLVAIY